jgi:hypothetical protein
VKLGSRAKIRAQLPAADYYITGDAERRRAAVAVAVGTVSHLACIEHVREDPKNCTSSEGEYISGTKEFALDTVSLIVRMHRQPDSAVLAGHTTASKWGFPSSNARQASANGGYCMGLSQPNLMFRLSRNAPENGHLHCMDDINQPLRQRGRQPPMTVEIRRLRKQAHDEKMRQL